mmetsp:Transcript_21773/g.70130  ORF Transcript_21773/g.70130 Transcript_21773/m.70130 type:complete len:90 (-) Transcript_21773:271-540(-)
MQSANIELLKTYLRRPSVLKGYGLTEDEDQPSSFARVDWNSTLRRTNSLWDPSWESVPSIIAAALALASVVLNFRSHLRLCPTPPRPRP